MLGGAGALGKEGFSGAPSPMAFGGAQKRVTIQSSQLPSEV